MEVSKPADLGRYIRDVADAMRAISPTSQLLGNSFRNLNAALGPLGAQQESYSGPANFGAIPVVESKIIENVHLGMWVQVRFPRSKKRRIRKKWANRERCPQNFVWKTADQIFMVGDSLLVSPQVARVLREKLADDANKRLAEAFAGRFML